MTDEKKPKRTYTRKAKVQPMAVYSVMVTVARGRKTETIYAESTRVENGCLVVVSMDGPQPLVEKTRYIPLASAEITVCERPKPPQARAQPVAMGNWSSPTNAIGQFTYDNAGGRVPVGVPPPGPHIIAGPLEMARRAGMGQGVPQSNEIVERNGEGAPVVTTGYLEGMLS